MTAKEASARLKINALLAESGWRFFDSDEGKANVQLEAGTKLKVHQLDEMGNDFENISKGYIDYLLIGTDGYPVAVLEAKREGEGSTLLAAKHQAREYAKSVNAPFVILSNGNIHYLWDIENGNPELITKFPTPKSFNDIKGYSPNPKSLSQIQVDSDYIVLSQLINYNDYPEWHGSDEDKNKFIAKHKLRFLRPYQVKAIEAIQNAAKKDKTRYLLEMATGTGKTLTTAALIKLFLQTGNAKRVLFLVDRIEL